MEAADKDPTAKTVSRAVGAELRRVRDAVGLTRAQLVNRLPVRIHEQTLAGYERGAMHLAVPRLIDLCRTLTVAAPDVLALALQRAQIDEPTFGLRIDLHAVVDAKAPELTPLGRWARHRLTYGDAESSGVVHLPWMVVQELAAAFGHTPAELLAHLLQFTPGCAPPIITHYPKWTNGR